MSEARKVARTRPRKTAQPRKTRSAAPAPGTVGELIRFVYPESADSTTCPPWPPDVFAVVATVMRRNGVYVRCVATSSTTVKGKELLPREWTVLARKVGRRWRERISKAMRAAEKIGAGKAVESIAVPTEVANAWEQLLEESQNCALEASFLNDDLCIALIKLGAFADEASAGIGLPWFGPDKDNFCAAGSVFLQLNGKLSFCHRVSPQKARVLAKKHTPQQGLTLRSMTHHLSLCMPWEVEAQWHEIASSSLTDVLNILLLPWPLKVDAPHFQCLDNNRQLSQDRTFEYRRAAHTELQLRYQLESAIDAALQRVSTLHAIILPELALTVAEWNIAETIATERGVLLVSGIIDDVDETTKLPVNSCRIQLASLDASRQSERHDVAASPVETPPKTQVKHHRWCLDRSQVLQYDLGGQLPSTARCWENSQVGKRCIFFATLGGWLTFSVLICEDLARQDPIAEVLRSVGPNLVVALLMDGPQLTARWSARYASVLADDPGTSVLTLTSLGMGLRSRALNAPKAEPSRVIALWKDKLYGSQEIALDPDSVGCVLSLCCEAREEYTADGRSDHKQTQIPVFSGIFQIPKPSDRSP